MCFRHLNSICFVTQSIFQTVTYIMTYISWSVWKRRKSKIAHKILYLVTHPGNDKQSVPLTLAIFQESATAAIKSYFPNPLDVVNFLMRFHKVFCYLQFQTTFQYFKTTWQWSNSRRSQARISSSCGILFWNMVRMSIIYPYQTNLMLLWQRLDVFLIWLVTCWMKTTITYLRQDSRVIPQNVISVNIVRSVANVS